MAILLGLVYAVNHEVPHKVVLHFWGFGKIDMELDEGELSNKGPKLQHWDWNCLISDCMYFVQRKYNFDMVIAVNRLFL